MDNRGIARLLMMSAVSALLVLGVAGPVGASPDDVANRVARDVMSPFCPGLSLHDCPSDASLELREHVLDRARAGWSYEQIVAELEAEYGEDTIRATPPANAFGFLAWALPLLALLAGGAIAFTRGRRWSAQSSSSGADGFPGGRVATQSHIQTDEEERAPTVEERARLEAELDELRGRR